jgi:hypothetical protein
MELRIFVKPQGEIEDAISEGMNRFEQEYMGLNNDRHPAGGLADHFRGPFTVAAATVEIIFRTSDGKFGQVST